MSDKTYQDLINACRGFYGFDHNAAIKLPPRLEDAIANQTSRETQSLFHTLPSTFEMLHENRKRPRELSHDVSQPDSNKRSNDRVGNLVLVPVEAAMVVPLIGAHTSESDTSSIFSHNLDDLTDDDSVDSCSDNEE